MQRDIKKPLVHIIHNDQQIVRYGVTEKNASLIVANSQWIYNTIKFEVDKMIVYPSIDVKKI